MLLAGDEFSQTQDGNNNAYCQDSALAWLNWNLSTEQKDLLEFVRKVIQLRKTEPVFRRRRFFQGRSIHGTEIQDVYWLTPDGSEMSEHDWWSDHARCLGLVLIGDQIDETDECGERISGETFAILFNAHHEAIAFRLGARERDVSWTCVIDTASPNDTGAIYQHMSYFPLQARSLAVLRGELLSPTNIK